jgi:hypothetical protein
MSRRTFLGSGSATNFIALLGILATLLTAYISFRATVGTASWNGAPPKSLEARYLGPSDPLEDLSNRESNLSINVQSNGSAIKNLRIVQANLTNNSSTPILASDMFEPLSLTSDTPWRIVNVANQSAFGDLYIKLKWTKVNDVEFRSAPLLLNPGDRLSAVVYMTWDGVGEVPTPDQAPIHWHARINNLKEIDTAPDLMSEVGKFGPVYVSIYGWGVPFFLFSFLIYNLLCVMLMTRIKLISLDKLMSVFTISLVAIMNIFASDGGTTLAFGLSPVFDFTTDKFSNLFPLIVNAIFIIGLAVVAFRKGQNNQPVS